MKTIDVLRITKVRPADGLGQSVLCVRDRDQVNVIAHQAITHHFQALFVHLLFQQLQINAAVVIHKEHILAVVAALRDMMGEPDRYGSG
jgi:hypothetical protein